MKIEEKNGYDVTKEKWGFLREDEKGVKKDPIDEATGLHRTSMMEYLQVIYPEIPIDQWIRGKQLGKHNGKLCKKKPDFRNDDLRMVIEVDGLLHYKSYQEICKDEIKDKQYEEAGYKCVRIPYFIQLTNRAVKILFDREVEEPLFNEKIPSMSSLNKKGNTPACLCPEGVRRMAKDFLRFPEQYKVNVEALKKENNLELTGVDLLETEYNKLV